MPERKVPTGHVDDPHKRPRRAGGETALPFVRSSDTLETLKGLPPEDLYGRLALWMVDASEEEIASYWNFYRNTENRANEINDLIFINWARIDPQAAVSAAAGTPDEHYSWWAWSCHDPAGSLAAVMAQNSGRLNNVTWGLGEFHPDWVREHWDEIPAEGQGNALQGMAKWDDVGNPLEVLNFLGEKGYGFHERIFKVLATKDPWAAYEWIQKNGGNPSGSYGSSVDVFDAFVDTVAVHHPEMLERLAGQTPSGQLKWEMESKLFNQLLKTDPEAAVQQALDTKAPKVAEERLAAVGMSLMAENPDKAFEMAKQLFAVSPDALTGGTSVVYEGGSSGWGSGSEEAKRLMGALLAKEPARAMDLLSGTGDQGFSASGIDYAGNIWANRDLDGYADWVNEQKDPNVHTQAAGVVIGKLMSGGDFDGAAEWTMSLGEPSVRLNRLQMLMSEWSRRDPGQAVTWLENAEVSNEEMGRLKRFIPQEQ